MVELHVIYGVAHLLQEKICKMEHERETDANVADIRRLIDQGYSVNVYDNLDLFLILLEYFWIILEYFWILIAIVGRENFDQKIWSKVNS